MVISCPKCNKKFILTKDEIDNKNKITCYKCRIKFSPLKEQSKSDFENSKPNNSFSKTFSISELRVNGEETALITTLILVSLLLFALAGLSLGIIFILLIIVIIMIEIQKKNTLGSSVQVSVKQFNDIYNLCVDTARKLAMPLPFVYIKQDPTLNAYALSSISQKDNGIVVIHSALIDALSLEELYTIIAHEFTHIKCNHTRWGIITDLHSRTTYIPIFSDIMYLISNHYSRRCETTSDRGGLFVCQDLNSSIKALTKLAIGKELFDELDIKEFINQIKDVEDDFTFKASEIGISHPLTINRIRYLIRLYHSAEYKKIISKT